MYCDHGSVVVRYHVNMLLLYCVIVCYCVYDVLCDCCAALFVQGCC